MDGSGVEIWIDVLRDKFCDLSLSDARHLMTADVRNDRKERLVLLHSHGPTESPLRERYTVTVTKALRIFHGTELEKEIIINSNSTAVVYVGQGIMAVAAGVSVYFFKELKPYYKFELKTAPHEAALTIQEAQIWTALKKGEVKGEEAVVMLQELQKADLLKSSISLKVAQCQGLPSLQAFLEEYLPKFDSRTQSFSTHDCITCLAVIQGEAALQGNVILGTETGFVIWMDSSGTKEARRIDTGDSVAFLCTCNPHHVISCSRNSLIQCLQGMSSQVKHLASLESLCSGMAVVGRKLLTACITRAVHCFDLEGRKEYSLEMTHPIHSLVPMYIPSASVHCLLVAMQNGEMEMYHEQNRISRFSMNAPIAAVSFGRYGTEDCVLTTVFENGALDIKVLKRNFTVETKLQSSEHCADPFQELEVQTEVLDTDNTCELHVSFQQQLQTLRLDTIRAYRKLMRDGEGSFAENRELQLQLHAEIHGLGPKFQIHLEISSRRETSPLGNLVLCLSADAELYCLERKYIRLPWLLHGQVYHLTVSVEGTEESGRVPGEIKALVIQDDLTYPLLIASIPMPICQ